VSVLAGLAERTGGQCNRLRCVDLATDLIQERLGCFLTENDGDILEYEIRQEVIRNLQSTPPTLLPHRSKALAR
jgi:hypothetical protein